MAAAPLASMAPLPPDQDRGHAIIGVAWTLVTLATVILALRFLTRIKSATLGIVDWLMAIALISFIIMESFLTKLSLLGGFRHVVYLTPEQLVQILYWTPALETIGVITLIPSKCAVGFLILRILGPTNKTQRWTVIITLISMMIFNVVNVIILWKAEDVLIPFSNFNGSWNAVCDALLALIPVTFFSQLNTSLGHKVRLSLLMSIGLIAAICAAVKTSKLATIGNVTDPTWETFQLHILASIENFLIIFCGSIPPIHRPAADYFSRARSSNLGRMFMDHSFWPSASRGSGSDDIDRVNGTDEAGYDLRHSSSASAWKPSSGPV